MSLVCLEVENKHIDYIYFNPMKHYNIAPKDWEYSSFKKYVNNKLYDINWCNTDTALLSINGASL